MIVKQLAVKLSILAFALTCFSMSRALAQGPAVNLAGARHNLLPVPGSAEFLPGQLRLDANFSVAVQGHSDVRLEHAVQRLSERTGLTFAHARVKDPAEANLVVHADGPGMKVQGVEEDESYSLEVGGKQVTLRAPTVVGVLRGLETFLQLVERDANGFYLPFVRIQDHPRFAWRGLLIDVCRHWEPVDVIERNLDAMAAVKLNVLHWHLSEDQGFRVESRRYPKLQEMGSDGLYYTQEQIREVVAYARDRGIRVMPEFDMPGHSTAWFVGYPEMSSGPGPYAIERRFGVFDPAFDPTRDSVYKFLDGFIREMAALFPDAFWHIGGDENPGRQWNANPAIQAFMKKHNIKDAPALQAYFNQRMMRILHKHGKRMVGWDEILHSDLPKDTVVQSWRGQKSLGEGAKQGFSGILSAGYYLDGMVSSAAYYAVDPLPAASDLNPEQAGRILGGEACMWGELVTPDNIDSRIWPRAAGVAERLWSPREVNDADDLNRRLTVVSLELEEAGVRHLSGPEEMLRQLAGTRDIAPLRELMRLVEPLSLGERQRASRATQLTSLTSFGDIAVPDAPVRRQLARLVAGALGNGPERDAARQALAAEFKRWRGLPAALAALAEQAPRVHDADDAATDLATLGETGEQVLTYLSQGVSPPQEWLDAKRALLDQAAKPKGLLRLAVVDAMKPLIVPAQTPAPQP